MAERRGDQPAPETGPRLPPAIHVGLSPVQQAYGRFARHFKDCGQCRGIDGGDCAEAMELWQAYKAEDADASQRLARGGM